MEEVQSEVKCTAIDSITSLALSNNSKITLANAESFPLKDRKKQPLAYYDGIKFLVKELVDKTVPYNPTTGDIIVEGGSLTLKLIEKGFAKCKKECKINTLLEAEQKAKEQKIGFWGPNCQKITPELNEKNLKDYLPFMQKNRQSSLFTQKVEGLKLHVFCLDYNIKAVVYFCELKIPRINGLDARTAWGQVQGFLCKTLLNKAVQFRFDKEDVYKGEVSLYGNLVSGGNNVRNQLLKQGLAELSSNSRNFLTKQEWEQASSAQEYGKKNLRGLYGFNKNKTRDFKDEPDQQKMTLKVTGKVKQYQVWIKEQRRINNLGNRNPTEQITQIISQLIWDRKQQLNDIRIKKLRVVSQVFTVLMLNKTAKFIPKLKEYMHATCVLINNLAERLPAKLQSVDFIRLINILLRGLIFCLHELKDRKQQFVQAQLELIIRQVFRLVYLGNPVLHAKLFGRLKDLQLDNFQFSVLDLSGISSMSEVSDGEQNTGRHREESKKKVQESYLKVRVSSSLLLSLMFKAVPALLQTHWQYITRSNTFSEEFNQHIRQLKLKFQGQVMSLEQRQRVLSLMRINFGQHSLLSLLVFEESSRVKSNLLECVSSFLTNFQGRKILPSLDIALLEKETRSFVPKSLVVFYTYRNVFYTLLFCLYHQKNLEVAQVTLKTLTLLVQHTALLQKMTYAQGLHILIGSFIVPILEFPSQSTQISILQQSAVSCLSAIVSCDHIWQQLDKQWFSPDSKSNVNVLLLNIIRERDRAEDPLVEQINTYMTKLVNHYLLAFIRGDPSIWKQLSEINKQKPNSSFGKVIEQLCRKTSPNDDQDEQHQETRLTHEESDFYEGFLGQYLPKWIESHQNCESAQQLIEVIEILTCLSNTVLARENYKRVRAFSVYCFQQLSSQQEQIKHQQINEVEPPFKPIVKVEQFRNNVLVRVTYVKLIGHMSFCEVFRTPSIIHNSFRNILLILGGAKGINTLIKCSWALSNWCSVQGFSQILDKDEIEEAFRWLCQFSRSDRQKIASNGTRGIGMMIKHLPKDIAKAHTNEVEQVMLSNINHKSPKVSWNCSVALRTILRSDNPEVCLQVFNRKQFMGSLLHNFSRSNFKLQLQTLETLRCLKQGQKSMHASSILQSLTQILQQTLKHLTEYSFAEFRYINTLRREMLEYYTDLVIVLPEAQLLVLAQTKSLSLFIENLERMITEKTPTSEYRKELLEGEEAPEEIVFNEKVKTAPFNQELLIPVRQMEYREVLLQLNKRDHDFFAKLKEMAGKVVPLLEKGERVSLLVSDAFQQIGKMQLTQNEVHMNLVEL